MKVILVTLLVCFFAVPALAQTATVTLAWDANPASENVTKYTVYWGNDPDNLTNSADIIMPGALQHTITGLGPGVWYFRGTATNIIGEGGPSNYVGGIVGPTGDFTELGPPSPPSNPRFVILESSTDLTDWIQEFVILQRPDEDRRFWRLVVDQIKQPPLIVPIVASAQ